MLILLSPTKKQRVEIRNKKNTQPQFTSQAHRLMTILRSLTKEEIVDLFKVSQKIAEENYSRFQNWQEIPTDKYGSEALYTFVGEAFNNLDASTISVHGLKYLIEHLVIFSGLYGVLKPNDIIMPYRLDISDSLKIDGNNLYAFWEDKINSFLIDTIDSKGIKLVVNLASDEYTKKINWDLLKAKVITPEFRVEKNGKLKNVAIWSKKMRGLLTRKIAESNVQTEEDFRRIQLPDFSLEYNNGKYLYIKREE